MPKYWAKKTVQHLILAKLAKKVLTFQTVQNIVMLVIKSSILISIVRQINYFQILSYYFLKILLNIIPKYV